MPKPPKSQERGDSRAKSLVKQKKIGMKYDHPQSAAATIEGLAFLKRFSREPSLLGGEDV
jgi:hypothetical protein